MNALRACPICFMLLALVVGVFIGRSSLFGYSSAEACAIQAQTRIGAAACYDLYPRAPAPH